MFSSMRMPVTVKCRIATHFSIALVLSFLDPGKSSCLDKRSECGKRLCCLYEGVL
jgi:hypothetical protein